MYLQWSDFSIGYKISTLQWGNECHQCRNWITEIHAVFNIEFQFSSTLYWIVSLLNFESHVTSVSSSMFLKVITSLCLEVTDLCLSTFVVLARCWTAVPVPTGQRGRRGCWACRRCSRTNAPSGQPQNEWIRFSEEEIDCGFSSNCVCCWSAVGWSWRGCVKSSPGCLRTLTVRYECMQPKYSHKDTQHSFTISFHMDSLFTHFDLILSHHPSLYRILPKQSQGSLFF